MVSVTEKKVVPCQELIRVGRLTRLATKSSPLAFVLAPLTFAVYTAFDLGVYFTRMKLLYRNNALALDAREHDDRSVCERTRLSGIIREKKIIYLNTGEITGRITPRALGRPTINSYKYAIAIK